MVLLVNDILQLLRSSPPNSPSLLSSFDFGRNLTTTGSVRGDDRCVASSHDSQFWRELREIGEGYCWDRSASGKIVVTSCEEIGSSMLCSDEDILVKLYGDCNLIVIFELFEVRISDAIDS